MARKNPIGKIAGTAISSIKDPVGTAGKVVDQAKGTAALGKMVAEQVGKSAATIATEAAGAVVGRATGKKPGQPETAAPAGRNLRPVPDTNEAGHPPAENAGTPAAAPHTASPDVEEALAEKPPVKQATPSPAAKKAGAKKAAADKAAADKAPAAKTPAKKAPAAKTPAKKAPATKAPAKKAPAKKTPAETSTPAATPNDVAEVIEAAVAENPERTAATPAKKAPAKKVPAKKSPAKATAAKATADKTAATKGTTAKKAPTKKSPVAKKAPGPDADTTPSAAALADPATFDEPVPEPQGGETPLIDESTAKSVASETETLRKAAEAQPED